MAKILQNPTSGSIAHTTHSHNRAGQYIRSRRMPCQPVGTGRRGVVKTNFGAASSAWAGLDADIQLSWFAYAASHPYVDSLGQSIKLTGHQMYVAIASNLLNCGQALPTVPPLDDTVFAAGFTAFTAAAPGTMSVTPSGTGSANDFLLIALSPQKSGGVRYCKTFWQQTKVAGNSVAAAALGAGYVAQFGNMAVGQRIFYRLTPVNQYGVAGVPNEGFITVG